MKKKDIEIPSMHSLSTKLILCSIAVVLCFSCSPGNSTTAQDGKKDSDSTAVDADAPPSTWKEHWFEHDQLLQRVYYNDQIALYYDSNVDRSISWPETYFTEAWKYIKSVYGPYGEDPRLFVVLHTDNYSGGHPSTYMDASHDYRNVLDVAPYSWQEKDPARGLSMAVHEIGHIVEGATNGLQHNPAWDIWRDSKWAEIFIYDVYKGTGEEQFAEDLYTDMQNQYDDYPTENTQWFIDWFYPIYDQYGESEVLNNFYDLLADHFPQNEEGNAFTRRMNWGEFIHFWSGAAQKDLKSLAGEAFGWSSAWEYMLQDAREDFSDLEYEIEAPVKEIIDITTSTELTVSKENVDGADGDEGSLKLIDDNPFTKFFIYGYSTDFWALQAFNEAKTINSYLLTSGNDFSGRDPQSWTLSGSNDGQDWEIIDSREDVDFIKRNKMKSFDLESEVSYKIYRLSVTENAGDPNFQLSEWRLIHIQ